MTLMEKIADSKIRNKVKGDLGTAEKYTHMSKSRPTNAELYKSHASDARKRASSSAKASYGLKGTARPKAKLGGKGKAAIGVAALAGAGALAAKARKAKKEA